MARGHGATTTKQKTTPDPNHSVKGSRPPAGAAPMPAQKQITCTSWPSIPGKPRHRVYPGTGKNRSHVCTVSALSGFGGWLGIVESLFLFSSTRESEVVARSSERSLRMTKRNQNSVALFALRRSQIPRPVQATSLAQRKAACQRAAIIPICIPVPGFTRASSKVPDRVHLPNQAL